MSRNKGAAFGRAPWSYKWLPARIPLAQQSSLTKILECDNGTTFIGSNSEIPIIRVHNAKSRQAAKYTFKG